MKKGKTFHRIRQTVPVMNAAARRAIAITPGGIAAAKTICDRALMQREASHPWRSDADGSPLSHRDKTIESNYSYIQHQHAEFQARSECSLGRKAQAQLHSQQQRVRELLIGVGRASTEVRAAPSKSRSRRSAV